MLDNPQASISPGVHDYLDGESTRTGTSSAGTQKVTQAVGINKGDLAIK
jgi:hypothetical protein